MATKGSTDKRPLKAGSKTGKAKRKKAPKKRGRKPSPPTAKKRLAGIRAYNLVKKKLKIFYAERDVVLDAKTLNEYTRKLYEQVKKSSKSYKKGKFKVLNKTIDAALEGDRATEELFSAIGLLYPGSDMAEGSFAFWQLGEQVRLYSDADTLTIDYSFIEDGGLRETATIRTYRGEQMADAEFEALEIMNEIAQFLRDNEDQYPEKYLWFEKIISGSNQFTLKLYYDSSLTEETKAGGFNREGTKPKEKAESEKPAEPTEEVKQIQKTSALIEANNKEIIATIEKKTKAEENKTQVALSIKALRDIGEDVSTEMKELADIRNTIELYNAYILALESENQEYRKGLK